MAPLASARIHWSPTLLMAAMRSLLSGSSRIHATVAPMSVSPQALAASEIISLRVDPMGSPVAKAAAWAGSTRSNWLVTPRTALRCPAPAGRDIAHCAAAVASALDQ